MSKVNSSQKHRLARGLRRKRVRKKIRGTEQCPRLCVYKSLKHIYAQIVNDDKSVTLVSASSAGVDFKKLSVKCGNLEAAGKVGELLAAKATESGVKEVVFDRGGFSYHGQVKALADAAREKGLVF